MNNDVDSSTIISTDADPDLVRRLADLNGVATYFWTWVGEQKQVEPANLLRTLGALGVNVRPDSDNQAVVDAIRETEDAPWLLTLPTCTVVRQGDWRDLLVHVVQKLCSGTPEVSAGD